MAAIAAFRTSWADNALRASVGPVVGAGASVGGGAEVAIGVSVGTSVGASAGASAGASVGAGAEVDVGAKVGVTAGPLAAATGVSVGDGAGVAVSEESYPSNNSVAKRHDTATQTVRLRTKLRLIIRNRCSYCHRSVEVGQIETHVYIHVCRQGICPRAPVCHDRRGRQAAIRRK